MKPRVFVVMPFGVKEVSPAATIASPAVSIDFDEVYKRLVKPALEAAGCQPIRADEELAAGDIRTDMFYELVTADAVVADLSGANLNVFYELGIRHGVSSHGAILLHGGWGKPPFDLVPDRRFSYPGKLFVHPLQPISDGEIQAAVAALARLLTSVLEATEESTGSPVYKELPGLLAADWTRITNARSVYFGDFMAKWKDRVSLAREKCRPGDILTLSDDAPTRYHHRILTLEAVACMVDLERFDLAFELLSNLLKEQPRSFKAQCLMGLVLGRLGRLDEARIHMQSVARDAGRDPEAQGILARVYKDLWRLRWDAQDTVDDRRRLAAEHSSLAGSALEGYALAFEHNLASYFSGINVVTLAKLLSHVGAKGRSEAVRRIMGEVDQLAVIVKKAAECEREQTDDVSTRIWASATLGELAVIRDDADWAYDHYRQAADTPGISVFQIASMTSQLDMLEGLGFNPKSVRAAREVLRSRRAHLEAPSRTNGKVLVFSGHMTDAPDRPPPARFPEGKEEAVRERLEAILERWGFGEGDLAIGGGARGADTIITELCVKRGVRVRQLIALSEGDFLARSVRTPGSSWQDRYLALRGQVERRYQPEALGDAPRWVNVFERNNSWCLNTARAEASAAGLFSLLVWDEHEKGDGRGGTSHFARTTAALGTQEIVNPTTIP